MLLTINRIQSYLRSKISYEFPTEEALKKYLSEHPGADKSLHYVAQPKTESDHPVSDFNQLCEIFDRPEQKEWEQNIEEHQKEAIEEYSTDPEYLDTYLRIGDRPGKSYSSKYLQEQAETINDLALNTRLPETIQVSRVMQDISARLDSDLKRVLKGEMRPEEVEWSEKTFTTSYIHDVSKGSSDNICYITAPKGTQAAFVGSLGTDASTFEGTELMFPLNSSFRLKSVKKEKGAYHSRYVIHCEILPRDPSKNSIPSAPQILTESKDVEELFTDKSYTYNQWYKYLESKHKNSFHRYSENGFEDMNTFLRTGEYKTSPTSNYKKEGSSYQDAVNNDIDNLKEAMEDYELPVAIMVHRGMGVEAIPKDLFEKVLEGSLKPEEVEWTDKGFGSTSILDTAAKEKRAVFCHISLPKGTHGAYMGGEGMTSWSEEKEFLLAPNTTYRLKDIKREVRKTSGPYEPDVYEEGYAIECEVVRQS